MIFFEQKIDDYINDNGMNISPIYTTLKDGRNGWRIGEDHADSIVPKLNELGLLFEYIDDLDIQCHVVN